MKRLVILLFVLGAVAFMASCGSEVTEVAWKNDSGSEDKINEILWNSGEVVWNAADGFAPGSSPTESKEVASSAGKVNCSIWDTGVGAYKTDPQIQVNGSSNTSLILSEGSSNTYTLYVIK